MMSKKQRWQETLVNSKINKHAQKTGGKEAATSTVPVSSGGKQAGSTSKTRVISGRSNSLSSRGCDSTAGGSKASCTVKRGSLGHQGCVGHQSTRQASHPARPALRLCSSRSFSSLHTSSLAAAPFMRSSRSLNRLDQRSTGDDSDAIPGSQVEKGQTTVKKALSSGQLSRSVVQIRDQCHGDNAEKMMTRRSSSSEPLESSPSLVFTECHHHCNKVKKQEVKRSSLPRYLRLKSLKCKEAAAVPDLIDFKKGWMMRQDASGQWQKHWFVLTDQILRFYKDSVAEEAADVDGEINLSTCFDITDCPAQKDFGFQIHTRDGVHTLCAMTSGLKHNLVQAVLKNVKPSLTPDMTSSLPEQTVQQTSQQPDSQLAEEKAEHPNSFMQENKSNGRAEDIHQQQTEEELKLQSEREQSCAHRGSATSSPHLSSPISTSASSAVSPISPPQQVEQGDGACCQQCPLLVADESSSVDTVGSGSSTSTMLPNDNCSNMQGETEEQVKATVDISCECMNVTSEQQTGQLVKELEQTQKELSRLQQINKNLQDELQQERASHSSPHSQKDLRSKSSSEESLPLQQLQKMNHDLRIELEALKRSQEEAREAELRRRVDLLAQQAQLLVTGDATALAQAHLEQDRQRFHELQVEWEHCVASLKSQLSVSEEQRREAESHVTKLQQELESFHILQQEAGCLQKHLQEMKTQLQANEDTQAQKEVRLQKHLMLLQASQDRERRSLAASLAQAEQHSQDLQERLDRAEQQLGTLNKTQSWTREIEKAQQQLQEELACTVSALQKLQEEREQLDRRCQELQNQLFEADGEVNRLQSRLKTDETHYYNLEHSYERVCEELQVALGKVQQKEAETQDMREGYERLLDRKEQELSEVLLKMEVLGNSLEETEVKLNEVLKSHAHENETQHQTTGLHSASDRGHLLTSSNAVEHTRSHSCSIDSSYQNTVSAGDDPERFMSVIQTLETKLYVTEEKLRDIMQRLEEHQSHISCQDPHLCSQLTRSRATAQHLSLLLHSQAKRSQRFAQETENRCRMLVGRFQVALNIVQACRERLQVAPINIADFEKQLATVAACLQQGEKDAQKQQHESYNASKGEDKILNDETLAGADSNICANGKRVSTEDDMESVGKCLMKELSVIEKMVSALQSQRGIVQLSLVPREDEAGGAQGYESIISQRIALKTEKWTERNNEIVIGRVCAEAELIYAGLKFQQKYESVTQAKNQEVEHQIKGLADIDPPELAPYEEQVQEEDNGLEASVKPVEMDGSHVSKVESGKDPEWLERLISRLKRRANSLRQLCQEISQCSGVECGMDYNWETASADDLNWMQEQAKLIYLADRLHVDLEQVSQRKDKLEDLCKEQEVALKDEREAFNHTLCQLQEDNKVLKEELEHAEEKIKSAETGNQRLLENIRKIEDFHEERIKKLETEFQEKIRELQQIHEEEMKHLHGYYTKSCVSKEKQNKTNTDSFTGYTYARPDQTVMERKTKEELRNHMMGGDAAAMREIYKKDLKRLEASCDVNYTAMEEVHRKLIGDLQQQHQKEVAALLKEKDQLLQEETAATMAAIVAMRRAHKQELERSRQSQQIKESADITQLQAEHEKEIQLLQKELEVLSVQHTQKCLENSHLNQELQEDRRSLMQCQDENQELKKKQRETDEMSQLHFSLNGKQSHAAHPVNDFYEMEVILRAREAEMQFLQQEACSLREELKIARMDKIYAQNKLKALCTSSQDEACHDVNKRCEDFKFATWSPGRDASGQNLEESVTNTSNSAFLKKTEKSSLTRQIRGVRSKSLKEGLSVQERMKLFESF